MPCLPLQPGAVTAPPAVDLSVHVAGMSPEEPPSAPQSEPSPQAGSLRRPTPELAQPPTHDPHQSGPPNSEPKIYKKDLYSMEDPMRHGLKQQQQPPPAAGSPLAYDPQPPYQEEQPYRDYERPPYRYDGGGYLEPKSRSFDSHLHYENRVPHYGDQWSPYDQQASPSRPPVYQPARPPVENQHPPGYGPRQAYEGGGERDYSPPQPRYDEPPLGYDGRPRYDPPPKGYAKPGPVRYDEPPPPVVPPVRYYDPEPHPYTPAASHSPEPPKQYYGDPAPRSPYNPGPQNRSYKPGQYEPLANSDAPLPPPKAEPIPPVADEVITVAPKPLPAPSTGEPEDDPAMKPQSVLTRVKMFENKRSVSVDRGKEAGDSVRPVDVAPKPVSVPCSVPKANSLSHLDQEKTTYRAPEPQTKPPEDIVRSNHYDPDEDEEYYRKQLSYFDRRSFDSKAPPQPAPIANRFAEVPKSAQPQAQPSYNNYRSESVEKVSPVEKRYESVPPATTPPTQYSQPSPTVPPKPTATEVNALSDPRGSPKSKPDLAGQRPANREDMVQGNYLPQKSFAEKSPVNGTDPLPAKPPPATSSYNRYVPKPYTSSARPFERKFESPKFNHNLLPNDAQPKADSAPMPKVGGVTAPGPVKPQSSPQSAELDSGLDTFTRTADNRPKYQHNNINAVPKAIPVSPSALEDDEEDEGHTVVATARGIFNCNGGVLSSIETGVSIIIPQGAIPDGVEQEIYFKVCRDNSILPPLDKEKGETLLSPLVMCGPHGLKFQKPVELRLPHCDPKSWQNKSLPGDPNYLVGANCVSVLIDHF